MTTFHSYLMLLILVAVAFVTQRILVGPQGPVLDPPPSARFKAILDGTTNKDELLWAYVTGGTSGIGRNLAMDLLDRGFSVVISGTSDRSVQTGVQVLKDYLNQNRQSGQHQTVEGVVMDITDVDQAKHVLESLLSQKDVRIVIYNAFPERFRPIFATNSKFIRDIVSSMGIGLAEGLAIASKHWMQTNKTGVFLGNSAISSHADIVADEQTRQILVAVAEIPVVDTPLLRKPGSKAIEKYGYMLWNSDDYSRLVLHRVLDKGHSLVVEGWGWRMRRALSFLVPFNFGEHPPEVVKRLKEWM